MTNFLSYLWGGLTVGLGFVVQSNLSNKGLIEFLIVLFGVSVVFSVFVWGTYLFSIIVDKVINNK